MKTLANCTPREFATQTWKISNRLKKYVENIKKVKERFEGGEKYEDVFEVIKYICNDDIDETMELCGEMLFMTGEKFGNLDPENGDEDGVAALVEIVNSPRCIRFFTTIISLKRYIDKL